MTQANPVCIRFAPKHLFARESRESREWRG